MFKSWIWPTVLWFLKFTFTIAVLAAVWAASGYYNSKTYRLDAEAVMKIRVRRECLRPDYVQTPITAQEFDLTVGELDLLNDKLGLLNERASDLLGEAKRVEAMRIEFSQGKVKAKPTGIGGPAPVHLKKK